MIKKIFTIILLIIIVITLSACKISKKYKDEYKYIYLFSTTMTENSSKIKFITENGNISNEIILNKTDFVSLGKDNNNLYLFGIDQNERTEINYTNFDIKYIDISNIYTNSGQICSGRVDNIISVKDNEVAYLINSGVDENHYTYFLSFRDKCYEIPILVDFYYFNEESNKFGFFGSKELFSSSKLNETNANSFDYYTVDIMNQKIEHINIGGLEEYFPYHIAAGEIEMYTKGDDGYIIYSEYNYKSSQKIEISNNPVKTVYLVKIDLNTGVIIKKNEIQIFSKKMVDEFSLIGNLSRYFMFKDEKLYYFNNSGLEVKLEIYNLNLQLVDKFNLPKISNNIFPHINTLRITDTHFYYTSKENGDYYLLIYDISTGNQIDKIDLDFGSYRGLSIYGFEIRN